MPPVAKNKVHREVKELLLLFEVSQTLDSSMDLRETLGPVLKLMAEHMGMMRSTITLLNRETGELSIESAFGLSNSQKDRGRYRPGEGITGKVVQTGTSMRSASGPKKRRSAPGALNCSLNTKSSLSGMRR